MYGMIGLKCKTPNVMDKIVMGVPWRRKGIWKRGWIVSIEDNLERQGEARLGCWKEYPGTERALPLASLLHE